MHIDRSEKIYIILSAVLLGVFGLAVAVSSFAYGIQVPVDEQLITLAAIDDPAQSPFGLPVEERVRERAPGEYDVYIVSQTWKFSPGSTFYGEPPIRVPVGAKVTFYVTSKDIQHGFRVQGTNVNMMVLPGQVSKLSATFNTPGTYQIICHEYCGAAHQTMFGEIIVEG